jgi:hypothetical protein
MLAQTFDQIQTYPASGPLRSCVDQVVPLSPRSYTLELWYLKKDSLSLLSQVQN